MSSIHFRSQCWLFVAPLVLALLDAVPAAARDFEVSVGLEPAGAHSEYSGLDVDAGLFLGLGTKIDQDWSLELRWLSQDNAYLSFDSVDLDTFQLGARRHLAGAGDWQPFVQGGLHYGRLDERQGRVCIQIVGPCPPLRRSSSDLGVFAGGGVDWQFARRWALRFDGRLVIYDSERNGEVENDLDLTAGVVFRF